MSSYMAFRYIEKDNADFYPELHHENITLMSDSEKKAVRTAEDIDIALADALDKIKDRRVGIMLSGGMDSAIAASYLRGADAYTFRFLNGNFQKKELERAKYYADYYGLKLHYVDIDYETVKKYLRPVILKKNAPVHSIEPQIYQAALQAKNDGVEIMVIGNGSDYVFGGMDGLLAKDWTFDEFVERYIFTNPSDVLEDAEDVRYAFEKYRQGDKIDFIGFMNDITMTESYSSYFNAFSAADMPYIDPYAGLKMADKLDLHRIRSGESKYLIRELMMKKYPDIAVPDKNPMPRPVDVYFADWRGPKRHEFKKNLNLTQFSGNQKWQMYCLEYFLDMYEPEIR